MQLVPSKFFVTSGSAVSPVSSLNAFDVALIKAGIGNRTSFPFLRSSLVAELIERKDMPMGAVTHCVLAQMRGQEGETISAGIGYAFRKDGKGGYVAEGHLYGSEKSLRDDLGWKMEEMGRIRNAELGEIFFVTEELRIPSGNYGCCVASLVFTEYL